VPQVRLNGLGVGALGDEQGRAGVPQIMEADGCRQPSPSQGRAEDALVEVVVPQRPTLRRGEHEPIRVAGPAGRVHGQVVVEEPR